MDLLPTLNVWGIILVIGYMSQPTSSRSRSSNGRWARGRNSQAGYGYGQEMNNGVDYTHTVEEEVTCYRCIYHVVKGQVSGKSSCYERFRPSIASEETCHGSCYKTYMVQDSNSFLYTRGCIPNCIEHNEKDLVTKCCRSKLCNGATYVHLTKPYLYISFLVSVIFTALLTGRGRTLRLL